jgi:hypothetical protein
MESKGYYSDSTNRRTIPIIRIAEVVDNTDPKDAGLIKAKIVGVDALESNDSLVECVPLIPQFIKTLPKVGESVFLFQYEDQKGNPTSKFSTKRFWIGPIISQPTKLDNDPANEAKSILPDGWTKLKDPNLEEGAYGNKEDIVFQGRYNTDIIHKDREIWIRAGKTIEGSPNKFNKQDSGYIQVKYGGERLKRVIEDEEQITFVTPQPTTEINVVIKTFVNSFTTNGVPTLKLLDNTLPKEKYKEENVAKTEILIEVKDIKNPSNTITQVAGLNNPITEVFNESNAPLSEKSSRDEAIKRSKEIIDSIVEEYPEWKIKSQVEEIIKDYNGTYNNNYGVATFPSEPIEIKQTVKKVKLVPNDEKKGSVINMVANKINLISHDGEHTFDLSNPKNLITDEEQEKINNEAHPLVYGDKLVEFLELVKKYVNQHVHPYHGLPADNAQVKLDVLRYDLNTILNKNINSN